MKFQPKYCLVCEQSLILICTRDILRKKFCSHSCRQKFRYKNGEMDMRKLWAKCNTPEANLKKVHRGEHHPKWIKDRSKVKYRPRPEYTAWTRAIFERDKFTCQKCGQVGGDLQADHIKPYALYPELRWDLSNGRTLCLRCHKQTDTHGWKTRELKRRLENGTI